MRNAFYCNIPCKVLADLTDQTGDVVIEINTALIGYSGSYEEPDYHEPVFSTIIVASKYVTDKMIDVEKELKEKHDEMDREIRKMRDEANNSVLEEKRALELSIQELRNRAKKFSGMEQMLMFLEGEINWVVIYEGWRFAVKKIEECEHREYGAQACVYRSKREYQRPPGTVEFFIGEYSDSSGSLQKAKGFKTEDEAVNWAHAHILERLKDSNTRVDWNWAEFCDKYNIVIPKVEEYKIQRDREKEERRLKELAETKKKLAELEGGSK